MTFTIPELSLVVLIGPSGCGKSTFARRQFKPTEVLSSDGFRALVSDDENEQAATDDAFAALHFVAARRLARGKLTVVDATNVQPEARKPLVALAREYHVLPVAIVLDLQGWHIAAEYSDHAISGATIMRPGFQAMMREALQKKFDIVMAEALDRFSRDQEDTAGLFKRLTFAGVNIVTLAEGDITHLHIGFKGTMNALFLKDLAEKTHRGLRGRIEDGKSAGGLCYGYRVVKALNAGTVTTGEREVVLEDARVVERIFRDFIAGVSPKQIAKNLNREGIAGPFGGAWSPSTIYGNHQRGTGILNNELYVGRLVWNRLRYIKNPDTGKRVSRLNPEAEWMSRSVPQLRIVPDEIWAAAKARQQHTRHAVRTAGVIGVAKRPQYLFSGLTKCGICGAGFIMSGKNRVGCFGWGDLGAATTT